MWAKKWEGGKSLPEQIHSLPDALSSIHAATGKTFIVIIDEWDVLIRDEAMNVAAQEEYIDFMRGLFKGSEPTKYIHLAYLTGILPIKKIKTQSALNNFDEFTMVDAGDLASYIGFTENEVKNLCAKYHRDFEKVKRWYDGYLLEDYQVYNPKAVVSVMTKGKFKSYWSETGTYEAIVPLINMDFDGLKSVILEMISGSSVEVDISSFQNDTISFKNRDDVLTYLIHLGYLGYDQDDHVAFIPNEEIRQELSAATKRIKWSEMITFQQESEKLLTATLNMDAETVAKEMEKIHAEYASAIQYNNENSLSSVLTIGYLSTMQYYFKPIREFPTGRGFADFVFVPKLEYKNEYPALLVELKWNKNVQTAIQQIKDKKIRLPTLPVLRWSQFRGREPEWVFRRNPQLRLLNMPGLPGDVSRLIFNVCVNPDFHGGISNESDLTNQYNKISLKNTSYDSYFTFKDQDWKSQCTNLHKY